MSLVTEVSQLILCRVLSGQLCLCAPPPTFWCCLEMTIYVREENIFAARWIFHPRNNFFKLLPVLCKHIISPGPGLTSDRGVPWRIRCHHYPSLPEMWGPGSSDVLINQWQGRGLLTGPASASFVRVDTEWCETLSVLSCPEEALTCNYRSRVKLYHLHLLLSFISSVLTLRLDKISLMPCLSPAAGLVCTVSVSGDPWLH